MILAIVGSTSLAGNKEAERLIDDALDRYAPTIVVSGGAPGIDTMAVERARARGIPVQEFLPEVYRWEDGFKPRNMLIASHCEALVRIYAKGSRTYGSGWTRDRAAEMGKPTEEWEVDGDTSVKMPPRTPHQVRRRADRNTPEEQRADVLQSPVARGVEGTPSLF